MSERAGQFDERDGEAADESPENELLAPQEGKGYGEDEGEREESLPDEE